MLNVMKKGKQHCK